MKKYLLLFLFGLVALGLKAQDEAIFTHYNINPILINPAVAGFSDSYQLQLNARLQWSGFDDAPQTIGAKFNGPIGRSFGIGLGVISESAAQMTRSKLQLDYAFRFRVRDDWKVSAGFLTAFQRIDLDNEVTTRSTYDDRDPIVDDFLNGVGEFDASIGIFAAYRENTYGGLSFNNLVSSRLAGIAGTSTNESFFSYYTFFLAHRAELPDQKISLEPSILFRQIRNTPFQMDVNLKAGFLDDQIMAGVSYRSLGSLGLLLGAKLENFNLYYSYDVSFQRFQSYSSGTHELTVALNFKKSTKSKAEKIKAQKQGY